MQTRALALTLLSLLSLPAANAADIGIRVIAAGEVAPGVYGRVEFGTGALPPLVYADPIVIVRPAPSVIVQPVYLHVPPGHAKNWGKHCQRYDACGRPVYFVRSAEYDKPKKKKKDK